MKTDNYGRPILDSQELEILSQYLIPKMEAILQKHLEEEIEKRIKREVARQLSDRLVSLSRIA